MKCLLLTALLFPSLLLAQAPPPRRPAQPVPALTPATTLPDNYQITLTITDKENLPVEISVVVASSSFNTSLGDPSLAFSGTVSVEESGSILVAYVLGWETMVSGGNNTVQYKPSSTQGSVRLKAGEEVQIFRGGTRTARLSIKQLETAKAK